MSFEAERRLILKFALCVLPLVFGGCDRYPRDSRSTLEEALEAGVLQVGVVADEPWVAGQKPNPPAGLEPLLLEAFAQSLGVEVEWNWGGVEDHFEALARYELDLVVGGFTAGNPWKRRVAFTLPYYTSRTVVAFPSDWEGPFVVEGTTVAVRERNGLSSRLKELGAVPDFRPDLHRVKGAIAANQWEALAWGYQLSDFELQKEQHVMAVPPGENAMLMRLERFLLRQTSEPKLSQLLAQQSAR